MSDLGVANVNLLGNVRQNAEVREQQRQERLYGQPSFTGEDEFVSSKKQDKKGDLLKSVAALLGVIVGYNLLKNKVDIKGLIKNAATTTKAVLKKLSFKSKNLAKYATAKVKNTAVFEKLTKFSKDLFKKIKA